MDAMKVYNKLPIAGQNLACTVQGELTRRKRYSAYFEKKLEQYKKTGRYSLEQVKVYQDKCLKNYLFLRYPILLYSSLLQKGI